MSSPLNQTAYKTWLHLSLPDAEKDDPSHTGSPLTNCVKSLDDSIGAEIRFEEDTVKSRTSLYEMFTSNYMIGRVGIKIILMESNGDDENWTTSQEDITIGEIVQAADFLSLKAEENNVNVSWVYEVHRGVPTGYEPIQNEWVPYYEGFPNFHWEFKWMNYALSYLGYERDKWDGCFDMANDMRRTYYADWGFSVFVVMDENDYDHCFANDHRFAYTVNYYDPIFGEYWCNRCFVVMTYNNENYRPNNMDVVFRHETCHIFRAEDEYYNEEYDQGCEEDECGNYYGFLYVANGNCMKCNPNPADCIMLNNDAVFCDYTLGHIGWRDTDGDGPADPIDQNGGGWMWISDVEVGDIIYIYSIGGKFQNVLTVTNDNSFVGYDGRMLIWNGCRYDNSFSPWPQMYAISINGGDDFSLDLHPPSSARPVFVDIGYNNGKLFWELDDSFAYVRCFIYDEYDNQILWPIRDKLFLAGHPQELNLNILPSGQSYTAKFYGWRSDGGASDITEFEFYHGCRGMCGDANGDGSVNVNDAVYIINWMWEGGPPPQPIRACGNSNGDSSVNVSDAVYIINYVFVSGAPPGDCNPDAFPETCCPFEE